MEHISQDQCDMEEFCKGIAMEDPTKLGTSLATQPSNNYVKVLMVMYVCLKDVERNCNIINEIIKEKIIGNSSVSIFLIL